MKRIFGLDLIRIAAIVMVLLANSIYLFETTQSENSAVAANLGFIGLEIFFVLSGFLLALYLFPVFVTSELNFRSTIVFVKKRLVEIIPLYFTILAINVGLAYWMDYNVENVLSYFLFLQNFAKPIPPFFPESWGLPIIVFAAIAFPLILCAFLNVKQHIKSKTFLLVTVFLIFIFLWNKYLFNSVTDTIDLTKWETSLKTVTIFRLDSVFIGALLGWFYLNFLSYFKKLKWILGVLGISGISFLLSDLTYFNLSIESNPSFWNVFYLPAMSLSIACTFPIVMDVSSNNATIRTNLAYLSKAVFSIYLIHFSIVLLLTEQFLLPYFSESNILILCLVYLIISIILGVILHQVSHSIRKWIT